MLQSSFSPHSFDITKSVAYAVIFRSVAKHQGLDTNRKPFAYHVLVFRASLINTKAFLNQRYSCNRMIFFLASCYSRHESGGLMLVCVAITLCLLIQNCCLTEWYYSWNSAPMTPNELTLLRIGFSSDLALKGVASRIATFQQIKLPIALRVMR